LLDRSDSAIDIAPISTQLEPVVRNGLEIILHQPFLDKMRLRQRTPDLVRRMREIPLDRDRARFGLSFIHWSILFKRSSRSSNRRSQKPVIRLVQSISGESASG